MTISIKSKRPEVFGVFDLPSSKSISNRLLILKALINKDFKIHNLSKSDDTRLMKNLLNTIQRTRSSEKEVILDTANAGTVMRFLCSFLSVYSGNWILTGSPRMKERPIEPLVSALLDLNAEIEYIERDGFPPLAIKGKSLQGGKVHIRSDISSQFISALLFIGPYLKKGLEINLTGTTYSLPYVEMTISLMRQFGADIKLFGQKLVVENKDLKPHDLIVETDWSAASYWFEMAALSNSADFLLKGLVKKTLQGDSIAINIFDKLGVHSAFTSEGLHLKKKKLSIQNFEFDFTNYPDLAPAVLITCAALRINSRFSGLKNLGIKESDRLQALIKIMKRLGMLVQTINDTIIEIVPDVNAKRENELRIHAEGDHRIAMCAAPLAFHFETIHVIDGEEVTKSYPEFWNQMKEAGLRIDC